jgi:hypothetical protein
MENENRTIGEDVLGQLTPSQAINPYENEEAYDKEQITQFHAALKASQEVAEPPPPSHALNAPPLSDNLAYASGITNQEAITHIDNLIEQLEWLKESIQKHPTATSTQGLISIVGCIQECLPFFCKSPDDRRSIIREERERKAVLSKVELERDIALIELKDAQRTNSSLIFTLNNERKHFQASMPAYFLALETADALYDVAQSYIDQHEWIDQPIGTVSSADSALPSNVVSLLECGGVKTYRQLSKLSDHDILQIKGIGHGYLERIKTEVQRLQIPSLQRILEQKTKLSAPFFYQSLSGTQNNKVTFTTQNMKTLSNLVNNFEGWRLPKALTECSPLSHLFSSSGQKYFNYHFFGGGGRDFAYHPSPMFRHQQYDYHFLRLTPLSEMKDRFLLDDMEHDLPSDDIFSLGPHFTPDEFGSLDDALGDINLDERDAAGKLEY